MTPIDRLIQADRETPKRIAVVGDGMLDVWVHGRLEPSQDGCMKFVEERTVGTPGGADNAFRQLSNWQSFLRSELFSRGDAIPVKERYVANGKIVFRHDDDTADWREMSRREAKDYLLNGVDAVLLCDYDKGFLTPDFLRDVIAECRRQGIPCVADAKREPGLYEGAVLKCNGPYFRKHYDSLRSMVYVATDGPSDPCVSGTIQIISRDPITIRMCEPSRLPPVPCRNHVGAGDAFAATLTLALAHGLPLADAAAIAHSAGRVYVQHEHSRPPYPHEIRRDLDPVGGKVLDPRALPALRQSLSGRVVFTNGVFRIPHAGHAWLMQYARQQGDVLVVGINDDLSAFRQKAESYVLPLAERCELLAGLTAVDWIVPYGEDTPCAIMELLKPDLLVKGREYYDRLVPSVEGCDLNIAPPSPYSRHCDGLVAEIRGR